MSIAEQKDSGERSLRIRYGKVDSLSLYEVTEDELENLEKGGPASLMLNLGLSLLSIGISFLVALLSTNIQSDRTFAIFVIITVVAFVGAAILLLLWNKNRLSVSTIIKRIHARMQKEEPVDQDTQQLDAVDKK